MEFRLLGPVEVYDGGPVAIGGKQRRTLLCVLLVHAGTPVSTDRLVDELWGEGAPPSARKTVQAHVAHLRRLLGGRVIEAAGDGYVARLDGASIDARDFEAAVEAARRLKHDDPGQAATAIREALGLFRGAPLAGVADDAPSLRLEADRLNEIRLAATEELMEADLSSGDAVSVVERAERFVGEHPLRERAWGLLMLALYRSGRQSDALRAFGRLRTVLGAELGIEPSPQLAALEQQILDHDPDLTGSVVPSPTGPSKTTRRNPFKGLRPFDEDDAPDFFGRDALIRRIVEELTLRGHGDGLGVVAGPSGAGKSSVVRAGVIPALRETGDAIAVIVPGTDPFQALRDAGGEDNPTGLVVVDQAEELFTSTTNPARTGEFLDLVASASPEGRRWLLTIRADFLEELLLHPGMARRLERSLVLTSGLDEHEVAAAITGPANRVGVEVSPELVAAITRDAASNPAALPLLQYALTENFERTQGSRMDIATYRASGGISGTLTRRADSMLETLDDQGKDIVRRVLLGLVTVTTDGEPVRRRVQRDRLDIADTPIEMVDRIVERLGTLRLLTFDQDPQTGQPTIEIAHESLLQAWPQLQAWIDDARQDLLTERRLQTATDEWETAHHEPSFLLRGARLEELETWASASDVDPTKAQLAYLAASRVRADQETRTRRRRRALVVGTLASAALGMAALAIQARESANFATFRELVTASGANLDSDPELSVLLALEALERLDGDVPRDLEETLHTAVSGSRVIETLPHAGEGIAHVSPNGETFVMAGAEASTVEIRRIDTQELVRTLTPHSDLIGDAVFDPTGSLIATTSLDGSLKVSSIGTGEVVTEVEADDPGPRVPVFSNNGSMIAASRVGSVPALVWSVATGEMTELGPRPLVEETRNLEFSPDDAWLAVASNDGAEVWEVATSTLVTVAAEGEYVYDVGFTSDGSRLVVSTDSNVQIWDTGTWKRLDTYRGHAGEVLDLQISEDDTIVASASSQDVLVWELESLTTLFDLRGHAGTVDGIDLTPDNATLVTGSSEDRTARLWDITPQGHHELTGWAKADDHFPVLAVSRSGKL